MAKRKRRTGPPPTQETGAEVQREMDWSDAVSAVAEEIEALSDAISTLRSERHPVFVLIEVMLEKARELRRLMRQKWEKKGAE